MHRSGTSDLGRRAAKPRPSEGAVGELQLEMGSAGYGMPPPWVPPVQSQLSEVFENRTEACPPHR